MPPMGTINLHGSLLPQYRGAAPINWAIINGEKETGVTTFKLQQEIDTGNILLFEKIPIGENETAGELHDRMKIIGAELLSKTVAGIAEGKLKDIPQPSHQGQAALKHAPKIFTETCHIDWSKTTAEVYDLVRGLSPYPTAFAELDGKKMKVFKASREDGSRPSDALPGSYQTEKKTYLRFACNDGYLSVLELQLEGKKRMTITEFLRGWR